MLKKFKRKSYVHKKATQERQEIMAELSCMPLDQITQRYGQNARRAVDGRIISFTVNGYKFRYNNIVQSRKSTTPSSNSDQAEFNFQEK